MSVIFFDLQHISSLIGERQSRRFPC